MSIENFKNTKGWLYLYGAYSLNNDRFLFTDNNLRATAPVSLSTVDIPRGRGVGITNRKAGAKTLELRNGKIRAVNGENINTTIGRLAEITNQTNRYFTVIPDYYEIAKLDSFDEFQQTTEDAENGRLETSNFQFGKNALKFDIDVSNTGATSALIYFDVNFPEFTSNNLFNSGQFGFWIYFPRQPKLGTALGLGLVFFDNDLSGNNGVQEQYQLTSADNTPISKGWNFVRYDATNFTEAFVNGSPDYDHITGAAINYFHDTNETDMEGIIVDGLIWFDPELERRYLAEYQGSTVTDTLGHMVSYNDLDISFLAKKGYSESSSPTTVYSNTGISGTSDSFTFDFEGSVEPMPLFTVDINDATGLDKFEIRNETTGRFMEYDRTFAAGDSITIGSENLESFIGPDLADFNGAFPRARIGENTYVMNLKSGSRTTDEINDVLWTETHYPVVNTNNCRAAQSIQVSATGNLVQINTYANIRAQFIKGQYPFMQWSLQGNSGSNKPDGNILASGIIEMKPLAATGGSYRPVENVTGLNIPVTTGDILWFVYHNKYINGAIGETNFLLPRFDNTGSPITGSKFTASTDGGSTWSTVSNFNTRLGYVTEVTPSWDIDWQVSYTKLYT